MDQNYLGILAYCNEVRRKIGRKPVKSLRKGLPVEPHGCVLAETINFGARNNTVLVGLDMIFHEGRKEDFAVLPHYVSSFVEDFDAGALPEMVGAGWVE